MAYILHACGTRGTRTICGKEFLKYGGHTTCFVFKENDHAFVIDCGSGIENAKQILSNCTQIDVVLTHLHLDHIIGILNNDAFPFTAKTKIHSTFMKWDLYDGLKTFPRKPFWPIQAAKYSYINITKNTRYIFRGIELRIYESNHPDGASILKIKVNGKLIHFISDYEHGEYTDPESYLSDELRVPCDLLFYDGTYTPQEYSLCKGYGHSTYEEGAKFAIETKAKKLYIIHHDPERTDDQLDVMEDEAKKLFENTEFVKTGQIIEI